MILDKDCIMATTVAFDTRAISNDIGPGPGQPLLMVAAGLPAGDLAITHCDTVGGTYTACTTVTVGADDDVVEFRLPSNTQQFIKATFASGELFFAMEGNQTAK